jgi:hypothetical protein
MRAIKNKILFFLMIIAAVGNYKLFSFDLDSEWSEPENLFMLNSEANDYGLIYNRYDNKIYFNSDKSGYSYFYTSELKDDSFTEPVLLKHSINKPKNNQAYFTPVDEETSYITTFQMSQRRPNQNIFKSVYKKKEWSKPFIIDELQQDNFSGMTTISPDGNILVFISNSQNEGNETDLWVANMGADGNWGALSPLEELNSAGNEITPFLKSNDTLFFASDGYGGTGGFDIYFSVKRLGVWQRPKPFQSINTEFNESDLVFLPDNRVVFASDRPGGEGNLDFYIMRKLQIQKMQERISEYRLSLAAQVPNIRLKRIRSKYIFPMPASIDYEPKKIDRIVLDTIAERMKRFSETTINIHSINQSEKIVNHLLKKGISESRISLDNSGASFRQYLKITSDDERLLVPVNLQFYDYKFEPPVLELNLDAKPRDIIKNWRLIATYLDKDTMLMEGNRLPAKLYYDIEISRNTYIPFDSVKLKFINTDDTLKKVRLNIPFRISEIFSHNVVKKDELLYYEYNIFINDITDFNSINYELFKYDIIKIKTDRIIILYKNAEFIEEIKKYIKDIFGDIKTDTMKYDENDFIESDNLYKLLIRKIE